MKGNLLFSWFKIRLLIHLIWTYGILGGFGSYILGLNRKTYQQAGVDTEGNSPHSYKEPALGWLIGFLIVSNFVGLLTLVPLRKV